jgi:hypothetical protein
MWNPEKLRHAELHRMRAKNQLQIIKGRLALRLPAIVIANG